MSDSRNTIPLTLSFGLELKEEEKQKVLSLMRLLHSSIRIAHNMLKEGNNSQEIYHRIRSLFPSLPTRYPASGGAIIKATPLVPPKAGPKEGALRVFWNSLLPAPSS